MTLSLSYLDFLVSPNTYFEKKKREITPYVPDIGDYVAIHAAVGESQEHELWYGAKIMPMFSRPKGEIP